MTTDAFKTSFMEDFYNSINDSLKSRSKKFLSYLQVNEELKRIKAYYKKKEMEMFSLVQREVAISNEIETQKRDFESLQSNDEVRKGLLDYPDVC
jgi:hypothetical protein